MAEERKTPEEIKAETRALTEGTFEVIEEFAPGLAEQSREARIADIPLARERANFLFPEGGLGRVDEEQPQQILDLITEREGLRDNLQSDTSEIDARDQELERITGEFDRLLRQREDPSSAFNRASQEKLRLAANRQLQGNLGQISGLANQRGTRLQSGLVGDALQKSVDARVAGERDLIVGNREALEQLAVQASKQRGESLLAKEQATSRRREQIDQQQRRLEELQAAIRNDVFNRQMINLDNRSREIFGRVSTEEAELARGSAERTSARTEAFAAQEAARQQLTTQESLRIQEIEANKPAPSGGGGKWVCTVLHDHGLISDAVIAGDRAYSFSNVDDDTKLGYALWGTKLAEWAGRYKIIAYMTYPLAGAWAHEMAHRSGVAEAKSTWLGRFATDVLSVPFGRWIGRVARWCGVDVDEETKRTAQFKDYR